MSGPFSKFRIFLEMIKFEHSIFALPFAYLGLFLGGRGWPSAELFFLVTAAMVSFRSMAMGANRILDWKIDAANPRTRGRAIPAGKLSLRAVGGLTVFFAAVFFITCAVLGPQCLKLSPIPFLLAWLYPVTKRFTWFSHGVLGIILGIAPYGAWIASEGFFSWIPGLFMIGVAVWVAGFDIIYALQDLDFDRKSGLHSFPARFGEAKSLVFSRLLHLVAFFCWMGAGGFAGLGLIYWIGLGICGIFLLREHWIVHKSGLKKIQEAFFTMNAVISMTLFFAVLLDLFVQGALS